MTPAAARTRLSRGLPRLVAALVAGLLLAACSPNQLPFKGADITGSGYGQTWKLIDGTGQQRGVTDYQGKVLLVYFGFTHCPDICPATLGHLKDVLRLLGDKADQTQVLFVTVDAENDTPTALAKYLESFGPHFTGLSGSAAALEAAAKDFRVYAKNTSAGQGVAFEHAGFVYALDRQGKPRVLYGPETPPQDIASDVSRLLSQ